MMKYDEVKKTAESMERRIIEYIDASGIEKQDELMMELAATFVTCACIKLEDKFDDITRLSKHLTWLSKSCFEALDGVYDGSREYKVLNEDGRYDS